MKVEEYDGSQERLVLTGLVVDERVLGRVAAKWEADGLFASEWSNLVGKWCVDYYRKHGKPPGRHVESLFAAWASRRKDDPTVRSVETFLRHLSDEFERGDGVNADFVTDAAARHFLMVRLAKHRDELTGHIDNHDPEAGEACALSFRKVHLGQGSCVNVFNDQDAVKDAFAQEDSEDLVAYPGALGEFFRGQLVRDSFVAFNGPEKSGKTYWLLDVAYLAARARRKVAFFEVGDMSQRQVMRRLCCRAALHPTRSTNPDGSWPCKVRVPTRIVKAPEYPYSAEYDEREYAAPLTEKKADRAITRMVRHRIKSAEPYLKLSVHPCQSVSALGVKDVLKTWEAEEGWVPDFVMIDYADLLNPVDPKKDDWHATDQTWGLLRGLSQEYHACVVTATQADSASYDVVTQSRKNFGWCKAKMAHVTAFFGINVTGPEKERGLGRLNHILSREGHLPSSKCVTYASCLARAQVAVKSLW